MIRRSGCRTECGSQNILARSCFVVYQILIDLTIGTEVVIYKRSQEIEKRLADIISLVSRGRYSTPALARALAVSQPTVSRCLSALRQRGYSIRPVKDKSGWSYELTATPAVSHLRGGGAR